MSGDFCETCHNVQPCPCADVPDQLAFCLVCQLPLYVPQTVLAGRVPVTCYQHMHHVFGGVVGLLVPSAGGAARLSDPLTAYGAF